MRKIDHSTLEGIAESLRELDKEPSSDWGRRHRQYLSSRKRQIRLQAARERGTHSPLQWAELLVEFGGRCVKCCEEANGWVDKDHIVPLHMDGSSDSIDNIQPLCRSCNCSKTNDTTNWVEIRRKHGWPFKKSKAA